MKKLFQIFYIFLVLFCFKGEATCPEAFNPNTKIASNERETAQLRHRPSLRNFRYRKLVVARDNPSPSRFVPSENYLTTILDGWDLQGIWIPEALIIMVRAKEVILEDSHLPYSIVRKTDISKSKCKNMDCSYTQLVNVKGNDADFTNVNFTGSKIIGGEYRRGKFVGANFTNTQIDGGDFTGSDFTNSIFDGTKFDAGYRVVKWKGAIFNGSRIYGVDFSKDGLQDINLIGTRSVGSTGPGFEIIKNPKQRKYLKEYLKSRGLELKEKKVYNEVGSVTLTFFTIEKIIPKRKKLTFNLPLEPIPAPATPR